MTRSEICTILTLGMATVASNVLALYVFSGDFGVPLNCVCCRNIFYAKIVTPILFFYEGYQSAQD